MAEKASFLYSSDLHVIYVYSHQKDGILVRRYFFKVAKLVIFCENKDF